MRAFISILFAFMLAACGSEMQVSATLNSTKDVKEGDSIFLADEVVGEVVNVEQQGDKTVLKIDLNNKGESSVRQNAAIVVNRLKNNAPIEIYNKQNEEVLIQKGGELTGLNSMFQLGAWMVGDSLSAGSDSLTGYVDAFQRYLNGDQFQQDKQVLEDSAKQLGKDVQGVANALTEEVKKVTKDLGLTEEKAAEAVEQFGEELAPVLSELSKSSEAIVAELEKFTKSIDEQNPEAKELGSTILASLLKTLEKVNESIDPNTNSQPAEVEEPANEQPQTLILPKQSEEKPK